MTVITDREQLRYIAGQAADARVNVELETEGMTLNSGPKHPATHGTPPKGAPVAGEAASPEAVGAAPPDAVAAVKPAGDEAARATDDAATETPAAEPKAPAKPRATKRTAKAAASRTGKFQCCAKRATDRSVRRSPPPPAPLVVAAARHPPPTPRRAR